MPIKEYEDSHVSSALDSIYSGFTSVGSDDSAENIVRIDAENAKLLFVSDVHKGGRNRADDFRFAERAYNSMLAYYYRLGYTLVVLGDSEELWEEGPATVVSKYRHSFELERKFFRDDRFIKLWGNHDDIWRRPSLVRRFFGRKLGFVKNGEYLKVHESVLFEVTSAGKNLGRILALHGHQGSKMSDRYAFLSKLFVKILSPPLQIITGHSWNPNTPSRDYSLRKKNNQALYAWAEEKDGLILIAGHTHRPVFSSKTHLNEIEDAISSHVKDSPEDTSGLAVLEARKEWVLTQENEDTDSGPSVSMNRPCYFNTGCCCFTDGDVTAIEISDGKIRLVHWPDSDKQPIGEEIQSHDLMSVFSKLSNI